jgi:sterol desaturase/sphingolipid hydroxylase (fatty acid hydroxylase superfamily)
MAIQQTLEKPRPQAKGSKRLFNNPILEALSRTHIAIPLVLFNGAAIGLLYYGISQGLIAAGTAAVAFVVGLLLFTLAEYLIHKHVFHLKPTSEFRKNIQYKFHGVHHDFPKDKMRLAMPPVMSIVLSTALFLLFSLVMGNIVYGFLAGFLVGYAGYLFVHYIVHAWRPPNNIFKVLWVHHGIHHYKQPHRAYGVSSPLWDYIFRTMPN